MPPAIQTIETDRFGLDQATSTIRFERKFSSSPEEAFAAWTDPDRLKFWWDPAGEPLAKCDIDLRVGGQFEFVTQAHPERPFTGTYREISPPHRLVFDAFGAIGRVTLSGAGAGTTMLVEIICSGPDHLQQFVDMGVATGTGQTMDNLVDYLNS
jgi:uncharacterized protein YndB with AHSA1/START domain